MSDIASRARDSSILLVFFAVTQFFLLVPVFKFLPTVGLLLGWPAAIVACWRLRPYSRVARIAGWVTILAFLLAFVRAGLPVETRASVEVAEAISADTMAMAIFGLVLCIARDLAAIVAVYWIGRLALELTEPVDDDEEPQIEGMRFQFRWWVISRLVAAAILYSIFFVMYLDPIRFANILVGLPSFARRLVFALPKLVPLYPCWNTALALFPIAVVWYHYAAMVDKQEAELLEYTIVRDPSEKRS